jgi:hypothetical protein
MFSRPNVLLTENERKCPKEQCREEFQNLSDELLGRLEYAAVPGVAIQPESGSWQSSSQVDRIAAGHQPVVFAVDH